MKGQVKSITKKSQNISAWYNDVIERAQLAEHGPVKGTMIWRPKGFVLWETVQKILDTRIKDLGAQSVYFPLFIPYSFFSKEKEHIKGFAPDLAVITHGGGEKLKEPLVVRPTSETIMYDAFSRWIQSFRDLPLIFNQWCNVVRWEKRPYYFLRTTEFLWQEGHSAHENNEDAQKMVDEALKMYVDFYQKVLGLYGYAGRKSESEKFPGADATLTFEILMPDGKIVQGCTSHNLGQNFAKVFKVQFQDKVGKLQYVYQTSWGLSTRSIGAMIMVHGDDNGLVLPPRLASTQVVIIPITTKSSDNKTINDLANKAYELLASYSTRVKLDNSDQSVGWKLNQYDLEGVPVRIEIGSWEATNKEFSIGVRNNKSNYTVSKLEHLAENVQKLLDGMQISLFEKSKQFTKDNTRQADNYPQFKEIMETDRGFIEAFWCEDPDCEAKIKQETKATTRCLPLGSMETEGKCIYCKKPAKFRWLFGQAY
ncbi:proline--tRNA ligase [Candidatus Daviesbacteria bacterium]|nr:proline--tRNA ligase [Candidatus Daviesbacteria bacterium]